MSEPKKPVKKPRGRAALIAGTFVEFLVEKAAAIFEA